MRRTFALFTLAVLLISLAPLPAPALAQGPPTAIRLKAATFRPGWGEKPDLAPGLTLTTAAPGKAGYYLVQFAGPVEAAWKEQLAGLGADILAYVPDYAFKVRMTPGQARKAEGLDSVTWVGLYQPGFKLAPGLVREGTNLYSVRIERGADAGLATAAIATSGAEILSRSGNYVRVLADASQLEAIARVLDVAWIQNLAFQKKHNEYAAGGIMGATIANNLGYDGSSQIVAVADTGLGDGTASGAHPDIPASRIANIFDWSYPDARNCYYVLEDGPQDVDSGHGTHCSGSVLSDGDANGMGKGVAPAARLVFQAVEEYVDFVRSCAAMYPDGYYLFGIPDDIRDLFQQAYNAGARVHSNSWGHDAAGDYDADSANADSFVWNNPDMVITTSAGNAGVDANADGVVDNDSIGSPATAKNIITVGASENDRQGSYPCDPALTYLSHDAYQTNQTCQSMGYNQVGFLGTWGSRYGSSFTAEPLFSDSTAGNAEQMASWSSRGPTDDGRIKPDVVAPGTWILSAASGMYQEGYGDPVNPRNGLYQWDGWGMPASETYKYMGGTSMSNPLTAGGAAVVRDYYYKAHGHNASAALVKATLINSADDMLDENNDGVNDNDYPIPNVHEGWGRVNLVAATDGSAQFVDAALGIGTGGSASYSFDLATAGQPFKVSLVWSDYPSTEAASVNLVNNLNLKVTAPGGTVYWGNNFSNGWTVPGGSAEAINNVENVYVQSAAAGTWTVEVLGGNVPQGPQPYALVVDGAFGEVDTPPSVSIVSPADGSTVSGLVAIQIDATDVEDPAGTLTVQWNVDGGAWQTAAYNSGTGYYEASWNSASVGDGAHTIYAQATDSASNVGSASNGVTVDNNNVNGPPVATFTYQCTALACTFDASGSYDLDGSIVSYQWNWGDGNTGSGVTAGHTYGAAGTFAVVLTVTDNDGATDTDAQDVMVSDTLPAMYVADIAMSGNKAGANRSATAVVTIHDTSGVPVEGATVYGTWSGAYSGSASGVTLANGTVTFTSGKVRTAGTFTFTVNDVVKSGYVYDPALNAEISDSVSVP